jgi:glycosyltransferase involved in cell wall biosynthesis
MVAVGMLKVATAVSHYPFHNFGYLKLLRELSKVFDVYVFAGSRLKTAGGGGERFKLCYALPSIIPRRVKYYVGPLITQPLLNLMGSDVVWLFDTAIPLTPLMIRAPIILDIDDPKFTPLSRLSLVRDLYLMRNRRVKRMVTTTRFLKDKLVKFYGIPEDKIEVIPHGVDLELFRPTRLPDEDVVLYYGTLMPFRSRFLIKVIEEVLKRRNDVRFIIIGDAPKWLREYLIRKNFMENIIMAGYVEHDKLPQWIEKAKICIFTQDISLGGRLSIKLLEYMASGRPIVGTDVDQSWPIKESGAGIVSPLDPEAFAEAVVKLLEDEELAKKLVEKGIRYARQYDWKDIVKKYVQLMEEVAYS